MTEIGKIVLGTIILSFILGIVSITQLQSNFGWFLPHRPISSDVETSPTREELLTGINKERAKVHTVPLVENTQLDKSAQLKATDMAVNKYFAHQDSSGKQGYSYITDVAPGLCQYISENIYAGTGDYNTTQSAIDWWMHSKPHHDAILDPKYSITGFGIDDGRVVEHFCQVR